MSTASNYLTLHGIVVFEIVCLGKQFVSEVNKGRKIFKLVMSAGYVFCNLFMCSLGMYVFLRSGLL